MFKNWGLKSRLIFQTILPTIVVTIFLGCYFTFVRTSDLQDNLISHGELIQTQLVSYAAHSIQANQIDNLNEWIMDAEKDDTVSTITIYKDDGSILAGGDKQVLSRGDIINLKLTTNNTIIKEGRVFVFIDKVKLPIPLSKNFKSNENTNKKSNLYDLKRNYWAVISISDKHYKDQMFYAILALIIAFACGLLIAILFGLKISQEVARPILAAVKAVNKIKNGNLTATIETPCQGEMLLLKDGINSMASQLRNVHKNMQDNIKKATKELTNTLQEIANKNDQLYEARQDALIASKAKSEFLANMSHEIRTPMNSIIGFTDLLLQTDITKSQKDYLITIEKSSKNLLTIINDILDLSKIEAGSLELHIEEFNLKDTINDVITMLSPQALNKNIDVLLEVEDKIPTNIIQDSLRIQQVLTNLLNNAIKFTEKGKVDILVTLLKNEYHNYTIKFEIKDTGIGLTKDELKKLFASFSQADTSTTRNFGGTGLGLVISKNLVEKMSGEIGVESSYKKGSNFLVYHCLPDSDRNN